MRILFVHQNLPGQYRHIINTLSNQDHQLVGLGLEPRSSALPPNFKYFRYTLNRGNSTDIHPFLTETESKIIRASSCARAASSLSDQGFIPDLICAHPGWGEMLFLKDIWPHVPILSYQEYYYNSKGFDYGFDPEFPIGNSWEDCARLRLKNANALLSLDTSDWCVTPTAFQRSTFPQHYQNSISCIHDGIDTHLASPASEQDKFFIRNHFKFNDSDQIITFVNRTLEPYRGCHSFIRSIPLIQQACPSVHICVVGDTKGVSYGSPCPSTSWKDHFIDEIKGDYDPSKVHFLGRLSHLDYLSLLKISSCHIYLTYPFVLSWSLLESMSVGLPVVASNTLPVLDVISDRFNGCLVDFFSPHEISKSVSFILSNPSFAAEIGHNARELITSNYSLAKCIPKQLSLMQLVASKVIAK